MEHYKNIFLIGPSRAGKTSMASKLTTYGYNHIIMDSIIETMMECFPDLNIQHGNLDSPEFHSFLKSFCKNTFKYTKSNIIDLEVLSPSFANELVQPDESFLIYLGYPNISPEEKLAQIRSHDTVFDWTRNISDDELKRNLQLHIQKSKMLQEEAKKYGYTFIDTSFNREETLNKFIEELFTTKKSSITRTQESFDKYIR